MFLGLLVVAKIFPQAFPKLMGFPREVGRSGSVRGRDGSFAKTWFETAVGEWSAFRRRQNLKQYDGLLIVSY